MTPQKNSMPYIISKQHYSFKKLDLTVGPSYLFESLFHSLDLLPCVASEFCLTTVLLMEEQELMQFWLMQNHGLRSQRTWTRILWGFSCMLKWLDYICSRFVKSRVWGLWRTGQGDCYWIYTDFHSPLQQMVVAIRSYYTWGRGFRCALLYSYYIKIVQKLIDTKKKWVCQGFFGYLWILNFIKSFYLQPFLIFKGPFPEMDNRTLKVLNYAAVLC